MIRLNQRGVRRTVRPSGHNIKTSFDKIDNGGSIPPNVVEEDLIPSDMLVSGNNAANDPYTLRCKESNSRIHPARFPAALPEFFIKLITNDGDIVVDPFAGSNTTGAVAESLRRRWLAVETVGTYLASSKFRFADVHHNDDAPDDEP
jgi:DNA modification methylase